MACEDYWNAAHGRSYTLCGRIRDKCIELGGPGSFLGAPTSGEILNPDGVGKRASFEGNSSIYWHPDTDAHQIVCCHADCETGWHQARGMESGR